MLYRNISIFALACALGATGCRDNGTLTPADLSMGGGGTGGTGGGNDMAGGAGADMTMKNYKVSTIANMRMGNPGDFELDNVVLNAVTPSKTHPKIFVQDAAGGPFSAMMLKCTTAHPCDATTLATIMGTVAIGDQVTVKGTYIKTKTSGFEEMYLDSITGGGAAPTKPPVTAVTESAIERTVAAPPTAAQAGLFFQIFKVTPGADVVMYDWSPAEFKSGSTDCTKLPYMFGFGMAPTAMAGTMGTACTAAMKAIAASNATANANEILIGTDFYKSFTTSTDCACDTTAGTIPTANTKWPSGMAMTGALLFDVPVGGTTGYQFFSPTVGTVLTNLQ